MPGLGREGASCARWSLGIIIISRLEPPRLSYRAPVCRPGLYLQMKFRLGYATDVKHLGNSFWDPLQIPIDDNHKSQVTFRLPTSDEIERRPKLTNQVFIVAEGEYPVAQDISDILLCLESRRLPPGAVTVPETARFLGSDGMIKERYGVPVKAMPEQYRRFQSDVYDNLYQNLQRAFRLLRWRYNLEGPHNPLHLALDIQYSRDGETWAGAPSYAYRLILVGSFSAYRSPASFTGK